MSDKSKLFAKKERGDNITVAKMMGTTNMNVYWLLKRTNAKRHLEAIDALRRVIETRENLINQKNKSNGKNQ